MKQTEYKLVFVGPVQIYKLNEDGQYEYITTFDNAEIPSEDEYVWQHLKESGNDDR